MRYRRVLINGTMLVNIMTTGEHPAVKVDGLPEGTKFAYSIPGYDFGIWIIIEHESFRELEIGDEIPIHPRPEFTRL